MLPSPCNPTTHGRLLTRNKLLSVALTKLGKGMAGHTSLPRLFQRVTSMVSTNTTITTSKGCSEGSSPGRLRSLKSRLASIIRLYLTRLFTVGRTTSLDNAHNNIVMRVYGSAGWRLGEHEEHP